MHLDDPFVKEDSSICVGSTTVRRVSEAKEGAGYNGNLK
jgi:hypothetical protein